MIIKRCFGRAIRVQLKKFSSLADPVGELIKPCSHNTDNLDTRFKYINGELVPIEALVLQDKQNIEEYVIKTIKNYFRTTNRNELSAESNLSDHGLDSLDSIEIAMQLEEDLGYMISAENLSVFHKVKHYINFIEQTENFKKVYERNPLA